MRTGGRGQGVGDMKRTRHEGGEAGRGRSWREGRSE